MGLHSEDSGLSSEGYGLTSEDPELWSWLNSNFGVGISEDPNFGVRLIPKSPIFGVGLNCEDSGLHSEVPAVL